METIRLNRQEWYYDPAKAIGRPGGFGQVFEGRGGAGEIVAIKKLHITSVQAAHRELQMADFLGTGSFRHIIPILDSGRDADSDGYFVVMARAERSLQDAIDSGSAFRTTEAVEILSQVLQGLLEVPSIVHRDLKPGNVLWHESAWKVADFGIARFVEEATSSRTLKGCLSPSYAAPEQWELERASERTDIYALGCIGYALITGQPPFAGTAEELKAKHLGASPPTLDSCPSRLSSLLLMMLRKNPATRPSPERVKDQLASAKTSDTSVPGRMKHLEEAGLFVAEQQANTEAQRKADFDRARERSDFAKAAVELLRRVVESTLQQILEAAPTATPLGEMGIELGGAKMMVDQPSHLRVLPEGVFARSGWDTVSGAVVKVEQYSPQYVWSASLWYTCLKGESDYRWYEVAYFQPFSGRVNNPFHLDPKAADQAGSPVVGGYQIALGPLPIDDEHAESFADRWAHLLAKASIGKLEHPRHLPLAADWWK